MYQEPHMALGTPWSPKSGKPPSLSLLPIEWAHGKGPSLALQIQTGCLTLNKTSVAHL